MSLLSAFEVIHTQISSVSLLSSTLTIVNNQRVKMSSFYHCSEVMSFHLVSNTLSAWPDIYHLGMS